MLYIKPSMLEVIEDSEFHTQLLAIPEHSRPVLASDTDPQVAEHLTNQLVSFKLASKSTIDRSARAALSKPTELASVYKLQLDQAVAWKKSKYTLPCPELIAAFAAQTNQDPNQVAELIISKSIDTIKIASDIELIRISRHSIDQLTTTSAVQEFTQSACAKLLGLANKL